MPAKCDNEKRRGGLKEIIGLHLNIKQEEKHLNKVLHILNIDDDDDNNNIIIVSLYDNLGKC